MCTCLNIKGVYNYFGRNMDITHSFNEKIIITPKNYIFNFKKEKRINNHYAIIGVGTIINNYPLYSEATNEKGVSIAGLNFPNNCHYYKPQNNMINLTPYELIPYLLSTCKNLNEVKAKLNKINLINISFSKDIMLTPLHFMVSYKNKSIVIESLKDGLKVLDNPYNVLTNSPPFNYHMYNLVNYINLHNSDINNYLNPNMNFTPYSYGQGAIGLPGDNSSSSRFIRAFFFKNYLKMGDNETFDIIQFFKCLESVSMIYGSVNTKNGFEYTRYSTCMNTSKGILYYKTYFNPNIYSINLYDNNINSNTLITYDFNNEYKIKSAS